MHTGNNIITLSQVSINYATQNTPGMQPTASKNLSVVIQRYVTTITFSKIIRITVEASGIKANPVY